MKESIDKQEIWACRLVVWLMDLNFGSTCYLSKNFLEVLVELSLVGTTENLESNCCNCVRISGQTAEMANWMIMMMDDIYDCLVDYLLNVWDYVC